MAESPFLIVGLGNPGSKYALTYHNLGFEVIDELASRFNGELASRGEGISFSQKFQGAFAQTTRGPHKVLLLKPQTFMNLSGKSVREAVSFFKVDTENRLLVICDDVDIPPGNIRIRISGGSGGHNGMKSVIEAVGGEKFPRMRIGVGRSAHAPTDVHVLSKIPKEDIDLYQDAVEATADAVESFIDEGLLKAMNTFNSKRNSDES